MRVIAVICFLAAAALFAAMPASAPRDALAKRVAALEKLLEAEGRSNARDMLLAKWLDEYHPRGGNSQYHQSRIKGTR